ncbi:MAG: hypothetical protein WAZ27_04095 [Minisyncoccia bacterium]
MIRRTLYIAIIAALLFFVFAFFTLDPVPTERTYGVSFSNFHAEELGLDWKETYVAILDDLKVRKLRIPAYWPNVEPTQDAYAWEDLDYQIREAEKRDAKIVLAVGRRLPRWPECHIPGWAKELSWENQQKEILQYMTATVERYRNEKSIEYWQIENEPYLNAFANEHCGDLDESFLLKEIALVKSLDTRPILVTDSGNLGKWWGPYKNGDAFGTSMYIYFWSPEIGQFTTKLPPLVYRLKERVMQIFFGAKQSFLIELALEPWLPEPTVTAPIEKQLSRMDLAKIDEILAYAAKTGFETQYLWGAEWWYYMKGKEHPEFWEKAKSIYVGNKAQ